MPRRATRPGPPTLLLGVWGHGESSAENIEALLDDYIDGAGNVTPKFVVPLSTDETSEGVMAVFDYAVAKKYSVTVVYTKKPASKVLKDLLAKATDEHVALDPITDHEKFESTEDAIGDHFAQILGKKPEDSRLLFLWFEDNEGPDEQDQRVLAAVADCGVVALDLAQGLEVLDVAPAEPEPEGGDDTEPVTPPEAGGDDGEPDYDTVNGWPIRRIRSYAKKVAQADREDNVEDTPTDEELDNSDQYDKTALLDYLFPEDDPQTNGKPAPEPEPEPEPEKTTSGRRRRTPAAETEPAPEADGKVTPRRAAQMRQEAEAEGQDTLAGVKRRGRAAAKAQEPEDGAEAGGEGGVTGEPSDALERLTDALEIFADETSTEDEIKEAVKDFADAFADHIIDRIADRVEKEPDASAIRKEIAPPRPPGKPRKDGATPTRRRSAR